MGLLRRSLASVKKGQVWKAKRLQKKIDDEETRRRVSASKSANKYDNSHGDYKKNPPEKISVPDVPFSLNGVIIDYNDDKDELTLYERILLSNELRFHKALVRRAARVFDADLAQELLANAIFLDAWTHWSCPKKTFEEAILLSSCTHLNGLRIRRSHIFSVESMAG